MRTVMVIGVLVLVLFTTAGIASARVHVGFGFLFPRIFIGPPGVAYPPTAYYPYSYPYLYGYPNPGYFRDYRVWVPGYWAYGPRGRVWYPGHWEYRR